MPSKVGTVAGLICATLLLAACGGSLGALEGTWKKEKYKDFQSTLMITRDGKITANPGDAVCTGTVKLVDDVYKYTVDCGTRKNSGTFTLGDDGKTLTIDEGNGDDLVTYVRVNP